MIKLPGKYRYTKIGCFLDLVFGPLDNGEVVSPRLAWELATILYD